MLRTTERENLARGVIAGVHHQLLQEGLGKLVVLPDGSYEEASDTLRWLAAGRIASTANRLAEALDDPVHYDDNEPGGTLESGKPIAPDPRFTHQDLVSFGYGRRATMAAFRDACGLDSQVTFSDVLCAAGLLECDWALRALTEGDAFFSAYLVGQAYACLDWLQTTQRSGAGGTESIEVARAILASNGRAGGVNSGRTRAQEATVDEKEALTLREDYRRKGKADRDIASLVAKDMNKGVSTVRGYFKRADDKKSASEGVRQRLSSGGASEPLH